MYFLMIFGKYVFTILVGPPCEQFILVKLCIVNIEIFAGCWCGPLNGAALPWLLVVSNCDIEVYQCNTQYLEKAPHKAFPLLVEHGSFTSYWDLIGTIYLVLDGQTLIVVLGYLVTKQRYSLSDSFKDPMIVYIIVH